MEKPRSRRATLATLFSKLEGSLPSTSENLIPERITISSASHAKCEAVRRKFPALGSAGNVRKMAALVSLKKNGCIKNAPHGLENAAENPSIRITRESTTEIFLTKSRERYPILFTTLLPLLTGEKLTYREIYQQVAWHIHLGSTMLEELAQQADSIEELYKLLLDQVPEGLAETSMWNSSADEDGLSIRVGSAQDDMDVYWPLTNSAKIENPHACIIGTSGQRKTQFALDLLYQIREQNPDVSFTVMDYKGDLSEPDSSSRRMFESYLGCQVVTPGTQPIPTVPFQNTFSRDADQYALGVTDLLGQFYTRLGTNQRLALRECLADLISTPEHSNGIGFPALEERLQTYYEEHERRADGLTEVISRLSVLRAFDDIPSTSSPNSLITGSLLIRLNELAGDTLPVAFMVISRLYDEMRQMPEVERQGAVTDLRHVIFIDEAHHYLSVKSSPLARIIREGRSKGVAVFLATQSVSDLAGAEGADYREFLSNAFFFKTNLTSSAHIRALMPMSNQDVRQAANLISTLDTGKILFNRNLQRNIKASVLQASQFYRRDL